MPKVALLTASETLPNNTINNKIKLKRITKYESLPQI